MTVTLPPELEPVRERAHLEILPLKPLDRATKYTPAALFTAVRMNAGRDLPPYYLVYFLLVDLLGFPPEGRGEKVSWSVALDWSGRGFVVEHRKMGLGVFAQDADDEAAAQQIVVRIQKAVRVARPFFEWLASEAVARSQVNVVNNSVELYGRFEYLRDSYREKRSEYERRKDERLVTSSGTTDGSIWTYSPSPAYGLHRESSWLALSAVDAFFAWTEHVFIHVAVLLGKLTTASEIAELAKADWTDKFRAAMDLADPENKAHYDRMLALRKELRNYVTHGAFGKQGEAFDFHSGAGAVPVMLPHRAGTSKFKFAHGTAFDAVAAVGAMEAFVAHFWEGPREPARAHVQGNLPLILTMARNGTYTQAMRSTTAMDDFVEHLTGEMDRAANMDW